MTNSKPANTTIAPVAQLVPIDGPGRRFSSRRSVRLGDVDPANELRFDAIARYAQDVANDDALDAALPNALNFVVRKTVVEVGQPAEFREELEIVTLCNGVGSRWAGRQTHISGGAGADIAISTVWVHVDPDTARPQRLSEHFTNTYAESACGLKADARLHHPPLPEPAPPTSIDWPFRRVDLDLLDHVNNAVYWSVVEALLAEARVARRGLRVELEYKAPAPPNRHATAFWHRSNDDYTVWLQDSESAEVYATAQLGPFESYAPGASEEAPAGA